MCGKALPFRGTLQSEKLRLERLAEAQPQKKKIA
jgi:hypothetical protein